MICCMLSQEGQTLNYVYLLPCCLLLQSIEEAVRGGASPQGTRRAGVTGVATSWAAGAR